MKSWFIKIVVLMMLSLLASETRSQTVPTEVKFPAEVFVESWQKGNTKIKNQAFKVLLSRSNKSFASEVAATNSKKYKLVVVHNPYGKSRFIEHWEIELREILPQSDGRMYKLGTNLLRKQKEYPPETNFVYKEDDVGLIYPQETTTAFNEKMKPIYGQDWYYFKTVRTIQVESFCVVIRVGDYKFNKKNKNKLDLFEVFVEFTNAC
jgi:hypothetical protein